MTALDQNTAGATLTVDLGALAANWRRLGADASPATAGAVVKANAYGLGLGPVAQALASAGCRHFFVADLDEGLELRRALADAEIYVLHGLPPGSEGEYAARRLIPIISTPEQIAAFAAFARRGEGAPMAVGVQFDTGMNRLGLDHTHAPSLAAELRPFVLKLVMSHLACAELPEHPMNVLQRRRFDAARAHLAPAPASLANSAGIYLGPEYGYDLVRPGIALCGVDPLARTPNPFAEVAALFGKILQIRDVDRGETVGYGASHSLLRKARIATVAIGYADGFLRALSGQSNRPTSGHGYIGEFKVPVVGRISMDLITLDVTDAPAALAHPGASVQFFGGRQPLDQFAAAAGTIPYEILTRLGSRVHRAYRNAATP